MRDERGSTTPLLALLVVAVGAACLGLGRMGGVANARAKAQTAADAAALAGAVDGEDAARELAAVNGGELSSIDTDGDEVQVLVRLHGAEARARATARGRGGRRGDDERLPTGLTAAMQDALDRAGELLGAPVPVASGWRSYSQQERLYRQRAMNPYPVAAPGTSAHERGTAVDVPLLFVPRLLRVAARAGLCHPWPQTDPVHFELCERRP